MTIAAGSKKPQSQPEVVYRQGQPVAVILDIDDYQEMLERLDDLEDLEELRKLRSRPLEFRRLDEFLATHP